MAEHVPTGRARISVYDVDNKGGFFRNGRGLRQVYGGMRDKAVCMVTHGEEVTLRFEVSYNIIGQWKATIIVTAPNGREVSRIESVGQWTVTIIVADSDGREVYRASPHGSTSPLVNAIWSDELTLVGQ